MQDGIFREKVVHVWERSLAVSGPVAWPKGMLARSRDLADLLGWSPTLDEARTRLCRLAPAARELVVERMADARELGATRLDFEDVPKWIPLAHDVALARRWMPPAVFSLATHVGPSPRPRVGTIEFPDVEALVEAFVRAQWLVVHESGVADRIP